MAKNLKNITREEAFNDTRNIGDYGFFDAKDNRKYLTIFSVLDIIEKNESTSHTDLTTKLNGGANGQIKRTVEWLEEKGIISREEQGYEIQPHGKGGPEVRRCIDKYALKDSEKEWTNEFLRPYREILI